MDKRAYCLPRKNFKAEQEVIFACSVQKVNTKLENQKQLLSKNLPEAVSSEWCIFSQQQVFYFAQRNLYTFFAMLKAGARIFL